MTDISYSIFAKQWAKFEMAMAIFRLTQLPKSGKSTKLLLIHEFYSRVKAGHQKVHNKNWNRAQNGITWPKMTQNKSKTAQKFY